MSTKSPHATTNVECPDLQKEAEVNLELNVFRGANHAGIQVKTCSECEGAPTCAKECIHDKNAQAAHQHAIQEHQEELSHIGRNVIG